MSRFIWELGVRSWGFGLGRFWRWARSPVRLREVARARVVWQAYEAELKSRFAELGRERAAAQGIVWSPINWGTEVVFARDRVSGFVTAMVGFTVHFEADELLEDNEMAAVPREATAIFHYQRGVWGTGGKTLFNMDPELALARLGDQFEPLGE